MSISEHCPFDFIRLLRRPFEFVSLKIVHLLKHEILETCMFDLLAIICLLLTSDSAPIFTLICLREGFGNQAVFLGPVLGSRRVAGSAMNLPLIRCGGRTVVLRAAAH